MFPAWSSFGFYVSVISAFLVLRVEAVADGPYLQHVMTGADPSSPGALAAHQQLNNWNITYPQFVRALVRNGYPQPTPAQFQQFTTRATVRPITMIQTKLEMAMFLAQGGLQYKSEWGCPADPKCQSYNYPSWDPQRCGPELNQPCHQEPYSANTLYYGRGYIQLSWPVNYEAASWALYGDDRLWRIPEMVRLEMVSWDTAFWYWESFVSATPGVRSGLFGASTRAINGALECNTQGNTQAAKSRFRIYQVVFEAFELPGAPLEAGCYPVADNQQQFRRGSHVFSR